MNDNFSDTKVISVGDIDITLRSHLTLSEMVDFVESVVRGCFSEDDEYIPEAKDFLIRVNLINRYTNIELPEDSESKYKFLYKSDLVNKIVESINTQEFNHILRSIDEKLDSAEEANISSYKAKIDELYESMNTVIKQVEDLFKDMDEKTISEMASIITSVENGAISEESLSRALLGIRNDGDK